MVQALHKHGESIDINGALIIPMDPIDLSRFDPSQQNLVIVLNWDMDEAFYTQDGKVYGSNRVAGFAFDFDIQMEPCTMYDAH